MNNKYFNNSKYYIAAFKSKNHAIKIYYYLEKIGNKNFQLISTPCHIKAGCSYSIKFNKLDDFQKLRQIEKNIDSYVSGIYLVERIQGRKFITLISEHIWKI